MKMAAEEVVFAGVRIKSADTNPGWAAEHEAHGFAAELDGADDARLLETAGLIERDVGGDVYGGELLAGEQHARFGGAAELGDVLGVAGELAAGHGDSFLVERRSDHGVGLAGETHLGGEANVFDGGGAVVGGELAEADGCGCVKDVGRDNADPRVECGSVVGLCGPERGMVADDDPACQRDQVAVGEGLECDLSADAGGVADGDGDLRK